MAKIKDMDFLIYVAMSYRALAGELKAQEELKDGVHHSFL